MLALVTLAGCMGDFVTPLIFLGVVLVALVLAVALLGVVAWFWVRRRRETGPLHLCLDGRHVPLFEGADRDLEVALALYERLRSALSTYRWPGAPASMLAEADALVRCAQPKLEHVIGRLDAPSASAVRNSLRAIAWARERIDRVARRRSGHLVPDDTSLGARLEVLRAGPAAPWVGRGWRWLFAGTVLLTCAGARGDSDAGPARLLVTFEGDGAARFLALPPLLAAVAIVAVGFAHRDPARDLATGFVLMVTGCTIVLAAPSLWLPSLLPLVATTALWARATILREARRKALAAG